MVSKDGRLAPILLVKDGSETNGRCSSNGRVPALLHQRNLCFYEIRLLLTKIVTSTFIARMVQTLKMAV